MMQEKEGWLRVGVTTRDGGLSSMNHGVALGGSLSGGSRFDQPDFCSQARSSGTLTVALLLDALKAAKESRVSFREP